MARHWTHYIMHPFVPLGLGASGAGFVGAVSGAVLSDVFLDGVYSGVCAVVVGTVCLICSITVFLKLPLRTRRALYRVLTVLSCILFSLWLGGGLGAMAGLAVGGKTGQFCGWIIAGVICAPFATWLGWRVGMRYPFGQ